MVNLVKKLFRWANAKAMDVLAMIVFPDRYGTRKGDIWKDRFKGWKK